MSKVISLTLLTKPGCHLCDEARTVIDQALLALVESDSVGSKIELTEQNILDDPELAERYAEEIPVLQINGQTHAYWKIDKQRLLEALEEVSLGL